MKKVFVLIVLCWTAFGYSKLPQEQNSVSESHKHRIAKAEKTVESRDSNAVSPLATPVVQRNAVTPHTGMSNDSISHNGIIPQLKMYSVE